MRSRGREAASSAGAIESTSEQCPEFAATPAAAHVSPVLENLGSLNIDDRGQCGHHAGTEVVERSKRFTLRREDRTNGAYDFPRGHVHHLGLEENRVTRAIEVARYEERSTRASSGDEWVDRCAVPRVSLNKRGTRIDDIHELCAHQALRQPVFGHAPERLEP